MILRRKGREERNGMNNRRMGKLEGIEEGKRNKRRERKE